MEHPESSQFKVLNPCALNYAQQMRLDGDEHVLVRYTGPAPGSGQRVTWKVKLWTDLGQSDWSQPAHWETGLGDGDWTAARVEPHEQELPEPGHRPAHLFRRDYRAPSDR